MCHNAGHSSLGSGQDSRGEVFEFEAACVEDDSGLLAEGMQDTSVRLVGVGDDGDGADDQLRGQFVFFADGVIERLMQIKLPKDFVLEGMLGQDIAYGVEHAHGFVQGCRRLRVST